MRPDAGRDPQTGNCSVKHAWFGFLRGWPDLNMDRRSISQPRNMGLSSCASECGTMSSADFFGKRIQPETQRPNQTSISAAKHTDSWLFPSMPRSRAIRRLADFVMKFFGFAKNTVTTRETAVIKKTSCVIGAALRPETARTIWARRHQSSLWPRIYTFWRLSLAMHALQGTASYPIVSPS